MQNVTRWFAKVTPHQHVENFCVYSLVSAYPNNLPGEMRVATVSTT